MECCARSATGSNSSSSSMSLVLVAIIATLVQVVYANNASCSDAVPSCSTDTDYFVYKLSFPYLSDYVSVSYENISVRLNISIPVGKQKVVEYC
jgi:hypothetical protein